MKIVSLSLLLAASLVSCICSRSESPDKPGGPAADAAVKDLAAGFKLDESKALSDLTELTSEPHPFGSPRQQAVAAFLEKRLTEGGVTPVRDQFESETPNPAVTANPNAPVATTLPKTGYNIVATKALKDKAPCAVALGSHYDTKDIEGLRFVGANDSGSSTAVLLQQLAYLKSLGDKSDAVCDVVGIFFDGEEAVLAEWTDGQLRHPAKIKDNTYGSRSIASRLKDCDYEGKQVKCLPDSLGGQPLIALVNLDMVGSPNLRISRDSLSTKALVDLAGQAAELLGSPDAYDRPELARSIEDDHVAFRKAGVPAVDLIDFNNITYWHTHGDEITNISYPSMQLAGQIGLYVALRAAKEPKVFAANAE